MFGVARSPWLRRSIPAVRLRTRRPRGRGSSGQCTSSRSGSTASGCRWVRSLPKATRSVRVARAATIAVRRLARSAPVRGSGGCAQGAASLARARCGHAVQAGLRSSWPAGSGALGGHLELVARNSQAVPKPRMLTLVLAEFEPEAHQAGCSRSQRTSALCGSAISLTDRYQKFSQPVSGNPVNSIRFSG